MTTLDDAAEREIRATIHAIIADDSYTDLADAFRACWAKATEAAALKWQADAERYQWLKSESASSRSAICAVAWKYEEACTNEVNAAGVDAVVDAGRAAAIRGGKL